MAPLRAILDQYLAQTAGNGLERTGTDPDSLRKAVAEKEISDNIALYASIGMLIAIFVLAAGLTIFFATRPGVLAAVFTATGLSLIWPISEMRRIWREIVAIRTIERAKGLSPRDFRTIVESVYAGLYGRGPGTS
jgi:hypothetical protein